MAVGWQGGKSPGGRLEDRGASGFMKEGTEGRAANILISAAASDASSIFYANEGVDLHSLLIAL